MSTIAEKLLYLDGTKQAIKQAIRDKGVTVDDADTFRSYADRIGEIETGTPLDPDAQAFITAAGITDTEIETAIDWLVRNLKSSGLWSKLYAFYPLVGGTALTCKWNLKDPRDLDAAFRLTFNGGMLFSSTGASGNIVNAFANTHFNPSLHADLNAVGAGFACYTSSNNSGRLDLGCNDGVNFFNMNSYGGNEMLVRINQTTTLGATQFEGRGVFSANRTGSSAMNRGKIGVVNHILGTSTLASSAAPNHEVYIFAQNNNGTAGNFNGRVLNCVHLNNGLSVVEQTNINTIINSFNIMLNRIFT
jgi:hypothetical protein